MKTLLFLLAALPGRAAAAPLTLDAFLGIAREGHPFLRSQTLRVDAAREDLRAADGGRDVALTLEPTWARVESTSGGLEPSVARRSEAALAATRRVWATGGRVGVELDRRYTEQTFAPAYAAFGLPELHQAEAAVSYVQPLLKNLGGNLDTVERDLARSGLVSAEASSAEAREDFLLDLGLRFIDWRLAAERAAIAEARRALAARQLEATRAKRAANVVRRLDVLRAEDALRLAEQNAVLLAGEAAARGAELAVLVDRPALAEDEPELDLYALPAVSSGAAVSGTRVLRDLAARVEAAERRLSAERHAARPELDLRGRYARKSGGADAARVYDLDKEDASLGLALRYPLGNRAARAVRAKRAVELRRARFERERVRRELDSALRGLDIRLERTARALELNRKQLETARDKTAEEQRLFEQGRGDSAFVIQSQDGEQSARLSYAENAASYHALILRRRALLDGLLP